MTTTTSNSFVELLEKSRLVSAEKIDEIRQTSNGSSSAKSIAQQLVKEKQVTRWQAAMLLRGRHSFRLGKYRLLEPMSSGRMGDVYLAEHEQMGRRVAIHVLPREVTDDAKRVDQVLAESQQVAKLDHRNIVHVYDIDREGDRYFVVMEHVQGTDLETKLNEAGRVSSEEAAEFVRQALNAVIYAHKHDVLHLGLSPTSISVDEQGAVKVRDFGMASLAASLANAEDGAVERNRYAAPEQRGDGEVDQRADICSLGIIGFQLLTGQLPTASAKRSNATIEKIFRKMMAKRPEDRFQSAADAAAYLERWLKKYRLQKCFAASNAEEEIAAPPKVLPKAKGLSESPDDFTIAMQEADSGSGEGGLVFGDDLASLEQKSESVGDAPFIDTAQTTPKPAEGTVEVASQTEATPSKKKPSKKLKKKPEESNDSKEPSGNEDDAEPGKPRTALIVSIVGGVAALIIIALVVTLIIVINSKDDPPPVAAKPPAKPVAPVELVESEDDVDTDASVDGTTDNLTDETQQPNPDLPADGTETSAVDGDTTESGTEQVADSANTNNDSATVNETDQTGDAKKPDEPEKVAATPMPAPMPAPMPKEPAKPANPLAGLAKIESITLPDMGTSQEPAENFTDPMEIGPIDFDPNLDILDIGLFGGENLTRSKQKFEIKRGDGGLSQNSFEIFVNPSSVADGGELMIAKTWVEKKKLFFQWTQEARDEIASNQLRNCILEARLGAQIHGIQLREPVVMEPLVLDLEKGGAESEAIVEWMPNPAQVRMEISGLSGQAPPHRFDDQTGQVLDLSQRGAMTRLLVGTPNQELLFFKISANTKARSIEVEVLPQMAIGPKPMAFSRKKVEPLLAQLKAQQDFHLKRKQLMEKQKDKFKQQIAIEAGQANLVGQQAAAVEGMLDAVGKMAGVEIAVRIYYETEDGFQIDLARAGTIKDPGAK